MTNTGQKVFQWLIEINNVTGLPTGRRKPNDPADPDYIAPTTDYTLCPLPIPPTYSWIPLDFTCQQAELVQLIAQYSNFSSPFGLFYDSPTGRFYVVDNDDVGGNFWWFNPDTITGSSSRNYISGSTSDINSYVVDPVYRRILAVGDASGGAKVLDIATNTVTTLAYGTNTSAGSGRRIPIAMSNSYYYAFCSVPNIVRRYNRIDLSFVDEIDKTTIPFQSTYLTNSYAVNFVGSEIWVGAAARNVSEIARYSADFSTLIGTINLPGAAKPTTAGGWTAASFYWQSHFYDKDNDRYYVSDIGSKNIYVIEASTATILNQFTITNTRGKSYIDGTWSKNELDGKIYLSVRCTNNLSDSTANYKLYQLNPTSGAKEYIYPDAQVSALVLRVGTSEQWGVSPGNTSWGGVAGWDTDGLVSKYQ